MLAVLDYGAGNIASVCNLLQTLNADFVVSDKIEILQQADKILFPGVGHASFAMKSQFRVGRKKVKLLCWNF